MAARVMLLLLAVGVFVAIWSGDRRLHRSDQATTVAASGATGILVDAGPVLPLDSPAVAGPRKPHPMVAKHAYHRSLNRVETQISANEPGLCDISAENNLASPIPLPGGITPGEYRIVRSDGRVLHLQLSAKQLAERGIPQTEPACNLYLLHDGRIRWYYIRIDACGMRVAHNTAAAPPLPPVIAPKPRPVRDVLREWMTETESLLIRPIQAAQSAARLAVRRTVDELRLRWRAAVTAAADQWDRAAARVRRVAADSGASRR